MWKRVFLIHEETVAHYRIPIYNYLAKYLEKDRYALTVVTEGVQKDNPHAITHQMIKKKLSVISLTRLILEEDPDILIFAVCLRRSYLFPVLIIAKALGKKTIHWGHGRDLEDMNAKLKNLAYSIEQSIHDAIILYGESLRKYLPRDIQYKVFIANNTLVVPPLDISDGLIALTKQKYNIRTKKNIIFMGRIQKRKRVFDLIDAFRSLRLDSAGLIIVGPDEDKVLNHVNDSNIYKIGPIYGDESLVLLSLSDIFCIPGHVGLSIVDAFWCGLPVVTENVIHAPEIMYLKDGENGFMVAAGNIPQLAQKLETLLLDDELRGRFSRAARKEIMSNGHIDKMCEGFREALAFVGKKG